MREAASSSGRKAEPREVKAEPKDEKMFGGHLEKGVITEFAHGEKRAREPNNEKVESQESQAGAPTLACEEEESQVAVMFKPAASTFRFCASAAYSREEEVKEFIILALRNRCKTDRTLSRVAKFAREFREYAGSFDPPLPFLRGRMFANDHQLGEIISKPRRNRPTFRALLPKSIR